MPLLNIDQNVWLKVYPAIAVNAALLLYAFFGRPALRPFLMLFSATTLVDILIAGKVIPISSDDVRTGIEYVFVLVGDLRFIILLAFLLYGKKSLEDLRRFRPMGEVLRPALLFTFFPTLLVSAVGFAKPGLLIMGRHKFLAYELIFLALTFLWIFVVLPQKNIAAAERKFLRLASLPVFVFYGLWPLADILILTGIEAGYLLRVVPNLTYYCVFLWSVERNFTRCEGYKG